MKPWAAEQIPEQFAKYATGEPKGLDKPAFTKVRRRMPVCGVSVCGSVGVRECRRRPQTVALRCCCLRHVPLSRFSRAGVTRRRAQVYAAFLFRYFDANGDGALQASECEAALNFLSGGTLAVAVPQGCASDEAVVSKLDFWLMFKAMMGLSPPIKSDLETAADALIAAGFRVTEEEVAWLKQRVPVGAA
jgi:hypothetical protein